MVRGKASTHAREPFRPATPRRRRGQEAVSFRDLGGVLPDPMEPPPSLSAITPFQQGRMGPLLAPFVPNPAFLQDFAGG